MSMARCCDCGSPFHRDASESWKVRCVTCFVKRKNKQDGNQWQLRAECAERNLIILESEVKELERQLEQQKKTIHILLTNQFNRPTASGFDREFKEHLRTLIQFCHPDKHNGSQGATQVTQWLNDVKRRLPCA